MSPEVVDPSELLDEEEEEYEDESGFNFMVIDGDKKSLDLKNKVKYFQHPNEKSLWQQTRSCGRMQLQKLSAQNCPHNCCTDKSTVVGTK